MLKFTRNSVIAFDFKDALSFEGDTGPYIQYAVVRARNIFRKGSITPESVLREFAGSDPGAFLIGEGSEDIWSLWLRAGRRSAVLEQCIATSEPAHLAKHAFQLAQNSTTSTTNIMCSRSWTLNAACSCLPPRQSPCGNSSPSSIGLASKVPKQCSTPVTLMWPASQTVLWAAGVYCSSVRHKGQL